MIMYFSCCHSVLWRYGLITGHSCYLFRWVLVQEVVKQTNVFQPQSSHVYIISMFLRKQMREMLTLKMPHEMWSVFCFVFPYVTHSSDSEHRYEMRQSQWSALKSLCWWHEGNCHHASTIWHTEVSELKLPSEWPSWLWRLRYRLSERELGPRCSRPDGRTERARWRASRGAETERCQRGCLTHRQNPRSGHSYCTEEFVTAELLSQESYSASKLLACSSSFIWHSLHDVRVPTLYKL